MTKPKYIIVAGVNGAGKSSLFETQKSLFENTRRLNADEILQKMGGDWQVQSDNMKAMKEEIKQLHVALENKKSIHIETTLAGAGKAQENIIDKAHKNGFEVTLLYVTLNSAEEAINRVQERVKKGGHGVSSELIKKRYQQSHNNLPKIAYKADNVYIYDNSQRFNLIYTRKGASVLKNKLDQTPWIKNNLTSSPQIQKELKNHTNMNLEITMELKEKNKKDKPDF